ncbi:hypothetical protein B7P43_G16174 [Cryptotermes secundus]|uniref:Integrase catalytic domain-containing protein n=1 Tax=Cryptotermes secundus TaxID=105785 RepID=A0A2J7RS43_9NEOP|nr:hypothetical protein B7P43_G16174 [Cryptotermes secundus]
MDYFTKWPEVYAIPNQEASTIAEVLVANFFCHFGIPRELHSDQGRNFESYLLKEVLQRLGVSKTRTTPLHPQSDGMVERYVKTIEEHLRKVVSSHQRDWDESNKIIPAHGKKFECGQKFVRYLNYEFCKKYIINIVGASPQHLANNRHPFQKEPNRQL